MRLALLGASGRTGQVVLRAARARGHEVVALSRRALAEAPGLEVHRGDALDVEVVSRVLRGCDAVVCAIGPSPGAPRDQDSRLAEVLVNAMRATGVRRLALVTGAMQGEDRHLGAFYRRLARGEAARQLVADRHRLEARLLSSGLEVTVLRPPRLTDRGPSMRGPEVASETVITMLDTCSREDLARALLDAVEPGARRGALFVRSSPRDGAFWRAWLLRCALAELAGITLAAVAALGLGVLIGEPDTAAGRWLTYGGFLVTGAAEGAFIGAAQGSLLRRRLPALRLGPFVGWTVLPAVAAWAVGLAPSTFFVPAGVPAGVSPVEPPLGVVLLVSAAGGGLGGLVIGMCQALALRGVVTRVRGWVGATALAWALALPLDVLGATLSDAQTPPWWVAVSAAVFGLLAGLTFAVPTGVAALCLRGKEPQ